MFDIHPFKITLFICCIGLYFSTTLNAQIVLPHLEDGQEHTSHLLNIPQPDISKHRQECLSHDQRLSIKQQLSENLVQLMDKGIIDTNLSQSKSSVLFSWPLRQANGFSDPGFYATNNYVDHDERYPNKLKDYNCGTRTYDTDSGYSHKGIDISPWPFAWHKMDDNQVEIIAAAPGTIIHKADGNYDENCSFTGSWNAVYLRHDDGSTTWYGHLKKWSLTNKEVGQRVSRGEYLGIIGSSGNSTGPHLHFEVYDADGQLIDPYAGRCNDLNGNQSWWSSQKPYDDSGINKAMTHSAPPSFGSCRTRTTINAKDRFKAGDVLYTAAYLRHNLAGDNLDWKIYEPNNRLHASWAQSLDKSYISSWWYYYRTLPQDAPSGKWRLEVTYKGRTATHDFYVENDQNTGKPNLLCAGTGSLSLSGNSLSITGLGIENDGNAKAGSSHIAYYLSENTNITTSDIYLGEDFVRALEPGETDTESFSKTLTGIPAGTYYLGIIVDYKEEVTESNGNDNTCYFTSPKIIISSNNSKPNLKCNGIGSLTVNNNTINISNLRIKNDGDAAAGSSHIAYYLSTNNIITDQDIYIGEDFVRALAPGESSTESFSKTLTGIPTGTYYVGIIVDYKEEVSESNGSDNTCYYNSPKVTISNNSGKPNLVCADIGGIEVIGNYVELSRVTIRNVGVVAAGSSHVGYYLSTNTTITDQDIYIGEDFVRALDPGESSTESFSKTLTGIPDGTYYVGIIIDYKEEVSETSGSDNTCYHNSPRVVISTTSNEPNITCDGLGTLSVNNNVVNVSGLRIKNIGGGSARNSHVGYYLSTNRTITTSDIFLGDDYVESLDPNEVSVESFSKDVSGLSAGTYYFGIICDYLGAVAESDEDDNDCYYSSPRVVITANTDNVNLRCKNIGTLNYNSSSKLLSINGLQITNDGTARSTSSYVGYYLSTNSSISTSDIYLGEDFVGSLDPGEVSTESFSKTLTGIANGTYYVGVLADYRKTIQESDENDNDCTYSTRITIGSQSGGDCQCTNAYATDICEDFQDYRQDKISPQSSCWTTWSGVEGGAEDASVGGTSDGNQYLIVKGGGSQDIVLQLGNRTSGKYEYQFDFFAYEGEKAYYNILHRFVPGGSGDDEWAQEVFFDGNGTGRLKVNGTEHPFAYSPTKWIRIYQQFDISNNSTTLYVEGTRVLTWTFSYQANNSNGTRQLAANNFYPVDASHTFYIDRISLKKVNNFNPNAPAGRSEKAAPVRDLAVVSAVERIDFKVVPNPTAGRFELRLSDAPAEAVNVSLMDMMGRVVKELSISEQVTYFDLNDYPQGLYYLRLATRQSTQVKEVILTK